MEFSLNLYNAIREPSNYKNLPLLVLLVIGEVAHNEVVNLVQRQHFRIRFLDGHGDQRNVGVRRLSAPVASVASNFILNKQEHYAKHYEIRNLIII